QGAQEEGLIRHIGLSEVSIEDIKKAETYVEIVSVQNKYSHDFRKWEPVLEYCRETNKAFIPWYPLNAGDINSMKKIGKVAGQLGATPYQVALSWLLHHSPNILLIPGTGNVKHLEENMKAEQLHLTEEMLDELESGQ
ncbi:MAG TPA: aldo/keto reductase, partial [Puia sp.]|nr:aldo/keto reductase [Puia sp.]